MSERFDVPQCMPMHEQRPWWDWFAQHGIRKEDVAMGGWIERDEAARQIRYLAIDWEIPPWDPNGPKHGAGKIRVTDGEVHVPRLVQLEAGPLPFPV